MANAIAEAMGLTDGGAAEVIEFANGLTGRRQDNGRIALYRADGKPCGFTITDAEADQLPRA